MRTLAKPLLHVFQPIERGGKWYGRLAVNYHGREVEILVKTDQDLIEKLYRFAANIVQFGPEKASLMSGIEVAPPTLTETCHGCEIARRSAFGNLLADVADALPDPATYSDDMHITLANLAIGAGQYDRDDYWQAIYELNKDACQGDETALQWACELRDMVRSVSRGGVAMSGGNGPSLSATLLSLRR